jgi:hypothetical protein
VWHGNGIARTKCYGLKRAAIFAQRRFGFCAAIQIIKHRPGETPLGAAAQIVNVNDVW